MLASKPQTWALFCATKMDVRKLNLTYDEAKQYLTLANSGGLAIVVEELKNRGAIQKGNAVEVKDWRSIYDAAHKAGMEAGNKCVPEPMIVQQHVNMMDDNSPVAKQWVVDSGVCGFAWINVKPGNCAFANWCRKNNLGRTDSYYGGLTIWVGEFGQSYERKQQYADAFAKVLRENGIKAYSDGRLD